MVGDEHDLALAVKVIDRGDGVAASGDAKSAVLHSLEKADR